MIRTTILLLALILPACATPSSARTTAHVHEPAPAFADMGVLAESAAALESDGSRADMGGLRH